MYSSIDVAYYIIDSLTKSGRSSWNSMKLHKVIYIIQREYAIRYLGDMLIDDLPEFFKVGVSYKELKDVLRGSGSHEVALYEVEDRAIFFNKTIKVVYGSDREFIDTIVDQFVDVESGSLLEWSLEILPKEYYEAVRHGKFRFTFEDKDEFVTFVNSHKNWS